MHANLDDLEHEYERIERVAVSDVIHDDDEYDTDEDQHKQRADK